MKAKGIGRALIGIGALILALFAVLPGLADAGFGISPGRIIEDRLVPGATITKTIYLVQGNPEVDVDVITRIDAADIRDWLTFEQGESFVIPAGIQQFPFNVTIKVPDDADLGIYRAFINVNALPPGLYEEGGSGVAISLGGQISIELTVGDEVIEEFKIKALEILDVKEGQPLQAEVRIENTGNVPASPDSASFELFDKFGNTRLAFVTAESDQFESVPAFSEGEAVLKFPIDLKIAPGDYWGHVKVFDEEGKVARELRTVFKVLDKTLVDYLLPIGIGVLVIIILLILFAIKGKKRRSVKIADIPESKGEKKNEE